MITSSRTRFSQPDRARWAALAALLAASCAPGAPDPVLLRGRTMGTTYSIKVVGGPAEAEARSAVEEVLAEVNARFSTYDPDSEISRFNAHDSIAPFEASEAFVRTVTRALELAHKTGGAYDPTVLPVVDLYGFGPSKERRVPTDGEIADALRSVGHDKVEVVDARHLRKTDVQVQLDLSGFAKGHGVDRVSARLAALGAAASMVEIGGEVRCAGSKAGGTPWRIGVEQPGSGPGRRVVQEVVEVRDGALATSGDYRNFLRVGDAQLHHIVDPRTGRNAPDGPVSVSVRASSCALADGLATAFMVRGSEGAEEILARYDDQQLRVLFLLREPDGSVRTHRVRW